MLPSMVVVEGVGISSIVVSFVGFVVGIASLKRNQRRGSGSENGIFVSPLMPKCDKCMIWLEATTP